MKERSDEERTARAVGLRNARAILAARRAVEQKLEQARRELEAKSAELAHSLTRLRATLESTSDALLVTDDAGRVTDFNRPYLEMWGVAEDRVRLGDHGDLVRATAAGLEDPEGYLARIEQILSASPDESQDVLALRDGRRIERRTRILYLEGRGTGRVWNFRDVTDRERAAREHAYLAAIVTSSNDAIVSKTLDGTITSWNRAAERIFGYTAAEAVGRPIALIVPPDRMEEERELLERLRRGERVEHRETLRLTKAGRLIPVSLTISPVRDEEGRIIGASTIARDVTERDELLARERVARRQAEEASRVKDEFLATVSHELRTPLNAILGWAQVLGTGRLDAAAVRHAIEVVERNARIQAQVIEDILDVSRIVTGKLRLEAQPIMPAVVVESALDSLRPTAEAKGVRLHAALDRAAGPIRGDAARLQQIVWNLLSNAIKFTGHGGRVEVHVERVESFVEIRVSDTGEGIDPEFLPYVFERFRQADSSSSRSRSGLGLGLSIVRHLVELHSGTVAAASPGKGQGSTFTVSLPLLSAHAARMPDVPAGEARAAAVPGAASEWPALHGVRVLVVDDEPDTRELLRRVLEGCGAEVREADSVRRALEVVRSWDPEVVVSDIGLPGEDGYALIRGVREWERESGRRIPAIALTAYARAEDRMRALRAGFRVHVAKPVEPMELALIVAGALQTRGKG